MATEKRQRQDARRAEKVQAQQEVKAKQEKVRKRNRVLWIAVPAVLVVGLALWRPWNSDTSIAASDTTSGLTISTNPTTTAVPVTISKDLATKPKVEVPAGDPPNELQVKDLVVGTGPEAVKGSSLIVQYVGVSWSTKEQFDSSWDRNLAPFSVTDLGNAPVIPGWNEGLVGVRQGSRRQLVIPPDKGYGDTGSGDLIKPGETLVFVIDVLQVLPPEGAATTTTAGGAAAATTTAASATTTTPAATTTTAAATTTTPAATTTVAAPPTT